MNILTKSCALALAGSLFAATAAAGQLSVEANKTIPVRINGEAASIVLGNRNVADVAVHNENLIFITGKTFGTTNLMVFNKAGDQIYSTDVVVTVNSSNLVTVNRSGQNFTYDCAPECRPVISIGDQSDYFAALSEQHSDVQTLNSGN
ncbi:pilus assembly protein N-terminal domain-containing protein [Hyphomonas sp.]|uniref:pilus assembly protein N-terminal domain-containing protein n=1 Tax=Hyphomonas sp. TaxID=87 RepID=UPI0032EB5C19|tara:strand:+ start:154 stop:597 length:444 start_codon:yes stop_codon:yes gene_type:complete